MSQILIFHTPTAFLENLMAGMLEAERLNIKTISSIILLKTLIYDEESYMYEFLKSNGIKLAKARKSISKQVKAFAKKEELCKKSYDIVFTLENNKYSKRFFATEELYNIMVYSNNFSLNNSPNQMLVDERTFILSLVYSSHSEYFLEFLDNISLDESILMRYYEGLLLEKKMDDISYEKNYDSYEDYIETPLFEDKTMNSVLKNDVYPNDKVGHNTRLEIPNILRGCLSLMIPEDTEKSIIQGREKEVEQLITILLKSKKSNAILIGEPGVGKTSIVEHLSWLISKGKCTEELNNKKIVSLDVNDIIAGTTLRGQAEEKFKILVNFLERRNDVILFIDEIHTVLGAGSGGIDDRPLDLSNALKPILARGEVCVIGATTENEYNRHFSKDGAFKRRFETVWVKEPKFDEVYPMIAEQIKYLKKVHNIEIYKNVIDFIIMMASCFNAQICNPDRTLDLVDKSMAKTKMKGHKIVTKDIVISIFNTNYELYKKMPEKTKIALAYHEAGHYIFNKYSNYLQHNEALAVTIIPTDNYLGLTVTDVSDDNVYLKNYDACIDSIASYLAGRVSEKMFTHCNSTGASGDLNAATKIAKRMLIQDGLVEEFSNRNFENDRDELSMQKLNQQIDQLISLAYKRAEEVIFQHKFVLERIVEKLVEQGILINKELEEICKEEKLKQSY